LKGAGRPILTETARAALVGALRAVDYVLLFGEPNVEALLEDLRPDVHAKGTDYTTRPSRSVKRRSGSAFVLQLWAIPKIIRRANFSTPCARRRMPERRFLVVRLGSLGDILHTFPAVAALRESFPAAQIIWLTHPRWAFLSYEPLSSEVWTVETRALSSMREIIWRLRQSPFSAAIDYQGLWKSAMLPFFGATPKRIGFSSATIREFGVPLLYTDRVKTTKAHIATRMAICHCALAHKRGHRSG